MSTVLTVDPNGPIFYPQLIEAKDLERWVSYGLGSRWVGDRRPAARSLKWNLRCGRRPRSRRCLKIAL